jgi:hypothetical protein
MSYVLPLFNDTNESNTSTISIGCDIMFNYAAYIVFIISPNGDSLETECISLPEAVRLFIEYSSCAKIDTFTRELYEEAHRRAANRGANRIDEISKILPPCLATICVYFELPSV